MQHHETSDLHMHLNGSYTLAFLQKIAERNGAKLYFDELTQAKDQYHNFIQKGSAQAIQEMFVKLIWQQFSAIHKIIQTLVDVTDGTLNVIEICPTCHEKVNWWNKENSHPVTRIYQTWNDPVVSGTDDEFIFEANAQDENNRLLTILGYPENQNKTAAIIHQSQFKFS